RGIFRLARHPGHRRFRSAHLRGQGLSDREDPRASPRHERLSCVERSPLMPAPVPSGLITVAAREVAWIWRDRVALLLVLAIPLFGFFMLTATFSNAVVRNMRVDVVDMDHSDTSMRFIQTINA